MIIVLKIILCSSLLLALYYLFLQKEKMYRFNRFYLLFSLVFSCSIPFISITSEAPKPANRLQATIETTQQVLDLSARQEDSNRISVIWIIYAGVTLIFLAKAVISVLKIKNLKGEKMIYQNVTVWVTKEQTSPFSFLNTIYLGKKYVTDNIIDERIFLHEKSHLQQKHSLDLIFTEIIKAFTWFNPAIYFYRQAIMANHEFLADESVLENDFNIKDYQSLILEEIISGQNYNLTHTFSFKNTKKRFIMMNTKKSKLTGMKKVISIPVLMVAFGLFVEKTYAIPIETMITETPTKVLEPYWEPAGQAAKKNSKESTEPDLTEALEIPEELVVNIPEEKKIQDTIRPKEGKNTNLNPQSVPSTTHEPQTSSLQDEPTLLPQFPGGMNELRKRVAKLFDSPNVEAGKPKGFSKADILYTVNEAGNVVNIKVVGNNESFNNEALISFKKANENVTWKPAEKDGKPVNYYMKLPLTMSFE
ncbi:M56 family metallopeptidase [uncultured Chryseobacterium sp.]|uniref:M56 family metallopeptidase n=1 Tax=uncultured Chryseobacterium sp. TaxID=259322 RepID=UPI0025D49AE5|nr:M56 family metallopeptidase [uncultured Chryseobacterium sp.]